MGLMDKRWWVIGGVMALTSILLVGSYLSSVKPLGGPSEPPPGAARSAGTITSTRPGLPASGKPLATISTPPPATLAMADPKDVSAASRYTITFSPWGFGPGGRTASLVLNVESSTPLGAVPKPLAMAGRNVLVDIRSLPASQVPTVGGVYTGEVVLAPEGGSLAVRLVSARRD
jgi:hypothetical protein